MAQIARILAEKPSEASNASMPKCPPLQLPVPQRDESGEISTLNFHIWSRNLEILVTKQGWKPDYVKLQLGTNAKILPKLWRDMMMNANDLYQGMRMLKAVNGPLSSTYPGLVNNMLDLSPTDGSDQAVVDRCGVLIGNLESLKALHPHRSMQREEVLAILANIGNSQDLRADLVTRIREFDDRAQLPVSDSRYASYNESLYAYIGDLRMTRMDISIALSMARGRKAEPASVAILPAVTKKKEVGAEEQPDAAPGPALGPAHGPASAPGPALGPAPAPARQSKSKCRLCALDHFIWVCPELEMIKQKRKSLPNHLCPKCLDLLVGGKPHSPRCGVKRKWELKALEPGQAPYEIDVTFTCHLHGDVKHHKICCGAPGSRPRAEKVRKEAVQLTVAVEAGGAGNSGECTEHPIPNVQFLSENLTLVDPHGKEITILCNYDSHSGLSWQQNIPASFNFATQQLVSESFSVTSFAEKNELKVPVKKLRIKTGEGDWTQITVYDSPFPRTSAMVDIPVELIRKFHIHTPVSCDQQIPGSILIGSDNSLLHPRQIDTPEEIKRIWPHISTSYSILTNRLLLHGNVSTQKETVRETNVLCMSAQGKEEGREGCGEEEDIADEFGDLTFVGPDGWEYHPF